MVFDHVLHTFPPLNRVLVNLVDRKSLSGRKMERLSPFSIVGVYGRGHHSLSNNGAVIFGDSRGSEVDFRRVVASSRVDVIQRDPYR